MTFRLGLNVNGDTFARALSFARDRVDIYVIGIGAKYLDRDFGGKAMEAMKAGSEVGRGGKGNIFLSASGNSGLDQGSCSLDAQINSNYGKT